MATCLGLIITVTALTLPSFLREPSGGPNIPGGGIVAPGEHTEGVDPIIESVAVYPVTEDIRDVEDATIESIDETAAYEMPGLGNYLPTELPADDDGGVLAPDPNLFGASFSIFVMDYEPRKNKVIHSFENLKEYLGNKDDNEIFHFAYENVYIGISPNNLSKEELLNVVNSIQ